MRWPPSGRGTAGSGRRCGSTTRPPSPPRPGCARRWLPGGQLVALPIPVEAEIPAGILAPLIARAQAEADAQGIAAKAVTPFLLDRLYQLTEGRSLGANIALVLNNARFAAAIAREFGAAPG